MKLFLRIAFYLQMAIVVLAVIQPIDRGAILPVHLFYLLAVGVIGIPVIITAVVMKKRQIILVKYERFIVGFSLVAAATAAQVVIAFLLLLAVE